MADKKISQLPTASTPLAGTEVLPIVQSSTTDQVSVANLTAGRAVSAASLTLTSSPLPIASGGTNQTAFTAPSGNVKGLVYFDGTSFANDATVTDVGYDTSTNTTYARNQYVSTEAYVGVTSSINVGKLSVKGDSTHNGICATPYSNSYYNYYGTNTANSQTFYVRGDGVSYFAGNMQVDAQINNTGNHVITSGNVVINTSGKGITDSTGAVTANFTATGVGVGTAAPNKLFSVAATDPQMQFQSTNSVVAAGTSFGALTWYSSDGSGSSTGVLAQIDAVANRTFDGDQTATGMDFRILTAPLSSKNSPIERVRVSYDGTFTCLPMYNTTVGATNRDLYVDNAGTVGYVSSVRESKTNIQELTDTSWIYQLNPVEFNYRKKDSNGNYLDETDGNIQYGLIAEDVEQIRSDLCFYDENENEQILRGVQYSKLIPVLLKEIQNLKEEINALKGI